MSMARSHKTYFALVLSALAVAALAPAGCGSDEDDDGNGGSGASGSTDNSGAAGATGGATGSGGSGGGGGDPNVDCPEDPGSDACQQCAQDNCEAEVTACCDQDADAAAMGDKGCYDIVDCAREQGCSDAATCLQVCEGDINDAGFDAVNLAQPLGDCVVAAVDAGLCPECAPPGGAGGGGGGS
jgi:hypothetical protein